MQLVSFSETFGPAIQGVKLLTKKSKGNRTFSIVEIIQLFKILRKLYISFLKQLRDKREWI